MNDENNNGGVAVEQEQVQAPAQVEEINLANSAALQTELTNFAKLVDALAEHNRKVLGNVAKSFETRNPVGLQAAVDQMTTFLNHVVVAAGRRAASLNTSGNRNINTTLQTNDGRIQVNIGRGLNSLLPDQTKGSIRSAIRKGAFLG